MRNLGFEENQTLATLQMNSISANQCVGQLKIARYTRTDTEATLGTAFQRMECKYLNLLISKHITFCRSG